MNLKEVNARLKAAKIGVSVGQNGDCLHLRGIFPPKPGETKPKQREIALKVYANPSGFKRAEAEARKIRSQIDLNQFNWLDWDEKLRQKAEIKTTRTIREWTELFEINYFNSRARNPKSETTWKTEYDQVLRQLPLDEKVTPELLKSIIEATEPDTRTRKRYCMVLERFAQFVKIPLEVKTLRGKYGGKGAKRVKQRDLPTDEKISGIRDRIPNASWQYVFGLMACYGLRNHEIFYIDLEKLRESPVLSIIEHDDENSPKTGERRVWACFPEWWDKWHLWDVSLLPQVTGRNNRELGHRVTAALRRYDFHNPYNLRHAWAVRTIEFGLPVELAAQQMGHSYKVHTDIYHDWITDAVHQRAYDLLMKRDDRPLPP